MRPDRSLLLVDDKDFLAPTRIRSPLAESHPSVEVRSCFGITTRTYSIRVPNGAMPFDSTVFGNSPVPQIRNEPKSLYQSPSGEQGPVFTQSCNLRRSWSEI